MRLVLIGFLAAALAGCLQSGLVPCGDKLCPAGSECRDNGQCAALVDIQACEGHADGDTCAGALGAGTCDQGVCVISTCGNGTIDPLEVCDDGNRASGDGCRADCAKAETCGDAVLDEGEACDDGNANAVDGCNGCQIVTWTATAAVGGVQHGLEAALDEPRGIAMDLYGNVYSAEPDTNYIRKTAPDGSIAVVAGTGTRGFSGDGGQAASADIATPFDVTVDTLGNLYIADTNNDRIRKVTPEGIITTVAGTSSAIDTGDGSPAITAKLISPRAVAVDGLGNIFVADGNRIRRIRTDGVIETFAGAITSGSTGDGGLATAARLNNPYDVAIDVDGNVLIADNGNGKIRVVSTAGIITTLTSLYDPEGLAVDRVTGTIYVTHANYISSITSDGMLHPIAGGTIGFSGDGGPASAAATDFPQGIAVGPDGSIVFADSDNNRLRRIDPSQTITTIAGTGNEGLIGDGGDATAAQYGYPDGIGLDANGNVYIADTDFFRVRKVASSGDVSSIAGDGQYGYSGDGGPAVAAQIATPEDVVVDAAGNVYFVDEGNSVVRKIATNGVISTVAGTGQGGFSGDGGAATAAQLNGPDGLALSSTGDLLIADTGNSRIRRVDAQGTITTFAGNGTATFSGDGGAATAASLSGPRKVAVHGTDVFIADSANNRVRRVASNGTITTFAGGGTGTADGIPAATAQLAYVESVAVDPAGIVYVIEADRVRKVATNLTISTLIAGSTFSPNGDGGPVSQGSLFGPVDAECDATGALFIMDYNDRKVRRVSPTGTLSTVAGFLGPEGMGPVATARLATPAQLALSGAWTYVATGVHGVVEIIENGRVRRAIGRYPQDPATGTLANFRDSTFGSVGGVAIDEATGTIYITEQSANRVQAISANAAGIDPANPDTWTIAAFANIAGTEGDADGPVATATFRRPTRLLLDPTKRVLYVADTGNHAIRAIDLATSAVSTVVNSGHRLGYADGPAADALLYRPTALALCPNGDLFIADTGNNRVRRLSAGAVTTVLGDGIAASSGEGSPARNFTVAAPAGIACDAENNVFVTSTTAVRVLPANAAKIVDGSGPVLTIYGRYPRDTFPASQTQCLTDIVSLTGTGHTSELQVADACTGLLVDLKR